MHNDEAALHKKLAWSIEESRKFHYNPHYFSQMMADLGPLGACKELLKSGPLHKQSGFSRLWAAGRLDLSVEAIALSSQFAHLFREEERATANKDDWYLMPHDEMVAMAEADGVTQTASWTVNGLYSRPRLSVAAMSQCAPYRFGPIAPIALEAAEEETE